MQEELIRIRDFIEKYSGIAIGDNNLFIIENRVHSVMKHFKIKNFDQLFINLCDTSNYKLFDKIINVMTTNETFWFRDKANFEIIENILLPKYIERLRNKEIEKIRIWSSACSTGQEPYSIAMTIDNYINKKNLQDIDLSMFEIIASDICDDVLEKSKDARYDSIAMGRGMDESYINIYFRKKENYWHLNDRIKNIVNFKKINLKNIHMQNTNFDLVLCKYVLIYFNEQVRKEILQEILSKMKKDGVLFVGASEIIQPSYFKIIQKEYLNGRYYTFIE